ncbi:phosphodiester glycosidase family protein [Streptomyces sp. NPDC057694]|uniref:phosphodiester glycosidase family protein n=1 Tax=Streptomyces sp. NPDC057694 TaxID=3346216 RepID=UPI0036753042
MLRAVVAMLCLVLPVTGCTSTGSPDTSKRPSGSASVSAPDSASGDGKSPLPDGFRFLQSERRLDDGSPVRVTVLSVAPDARVRVTGVHGSALARAETVRSMARRAGALGAVNGTYFDIGTGHHHGGYDGDPTGLYAENGKVLSEAIAGRPALLVGTSGGRTTARIAEASTVGRVRAADGARREVDGVNRVAGRILGCGGVGGDRLATTGRPMTRPYNGLCTDPDEVVSFTREWGADTPAGPPGSTEVLLAADATVSGTRTPAGGPVPAGGSSLYGIGAGAGWLRAHAKTGTRMAVSQRITDTAGRVLPGSVRTAVAGSARLLRDGSVDTGVRSLAAVRQPRTLAGVTGDGALLLVAVDGRARGRSVGVTPSEAAELLLSLGAVDGINLDGGGSTTAVLRGELRNRPRSADDGAVTERRVADALAVLPE